MEVRLSMWMDSQVLCASWTRIKKKLFFSFFLYLKTQTSHMHQSFVTSRILMFIKHDNCKDKLLGIKGHPLPFKLEFEWQWKTVFFSFLSVPAASFQLLVAGCPLNGSWHMWPKCKSDSDFPFKWAPRGICTRPPLWPCGPFFIHSERRSGTRGAGVVGGEMKSSVSLTFD